MTLLGTSVVTNTGISNIDTIPLNIPKFGIMFDTTGKNLHNIESMNENK